MKQKVQLGALRAAPGAASLPRTGRGEALVQQPKPNSRANDSHNPPFSPGGEGERAPPRRRRAALGPMPYGNWRLATALAGLLPQRQPHRRWPANYPALEGGDV